MTPPDPVNPQLEALERLIRLFTGFKAAMGQALASEVTQAPMVLRMLQLCARQPGISQQRLAEITGRDKAQIARLIKTLLDDGLLERQPNPQDKRSHSLWPTDTGHAALAAFEQAQCRVATQLFGALDSAQLQAVSQQWLDLRSRLDRTDTAAAQNKPV